MKLALLLLLSAWATEPGRVEVKLKGLVCAFCAQGLQRAFEQDRAVAKTTVNLDEHSLELVFLPGQSLSDEVIYERVRNAGLVATSLIRAP